jgi:DNA-binding MarR family transcriptional regulator
MPSPATARKLNDAIGALSRFASSRRLDPIHAGESGVNLNLAAYGVLRHVIDHGPVPLGELSVLAHMQPSALSRQVKLLEDGGFITRTLHPDDGRVSVVEATPAGRDAHQRIRRANERLLARQLADWNDDELDDLSERIERLVEDLRSRARPERPGRRSRRR